MSTDDGTIKSIPRLGHTPEGLWETFELDDEEDIAAIKSEVLADMHEFSNAAHAQFALMREADHEHVTAYAILATAYAIGVTESVARGNDPVQQVKMLAEYMLEVGIFLGATGYTPVSGEVCNGHTRDESKTALPEEIQSLISSLPPEMQERVMVVDPRTLTMNGVAASPLAPVPDQPQPAIDEDGLEPPKTGMYL